MNQKSQFYNSAYDFYKTMLARQAGAAYVKPEVKPVIKPADPNPPVDPPVDPPVVPVLPVVKEVNWAEIGKQHGLYSSQQVKELQKKLGLSETGNLDDTTLERKAWYDKMKELGYAENISVNGVVNFTNNLGHTYFADGTTYTSQGKTNYDYKTLSPNSELVAYQTTKSVKPFLATEEQFRNSKYFRKHALGRQYIEIDGKKYPMMVTRNIEENNPLGLKNDMSYAFDPTTGKVRLIRETAAGLVHNKMFDANSTWIDISPFLKQEIDNQNNLQTEWDTWLKENPSPSYSLSNDYRRTYQQW